MNSVFGWLQDTYIGVEQEGSHVVQAGYQKGAEQAGLNLVFSVSDTRSAILAGESQVYLHGN